MYRSIVDLPESCAVGEAASVFCTEYVFGKKKNLVLKITHILVGRMWPVDH